MKIEHIPASEAFKLSESWTDEFIKHFFRYLSLREAVCTEVYADQKGFKTTGIGHLLPKTTTYNLGDKITLDKVMEFFKIDLKEERIFDFYNSVNQNIPVAIGLCSMAWTHGPNQLWNGDTHKLIKNGASEEVLMDWVNKNWDKNSPVNRRRNKMDLMLLYPRVDKGITYHLSTGETGTFVYIPSRHESYLSLSAALSSK